jgi:hypothetical protein
MSQPELQILSTDQPQPTPGRSKARIPCSGCGAVFIGIRAHTEHANHTWKCSGHSKLLASLGVSQ